MKYSKTIADIHDQVLKELVIPEAYPKEMVQLVSGLKQTLSGIQAQMSLVTAFVRSFSSTLEELTGGVDHVRIQSENFLKTDISQYLELKQAFITKTNLYSTPHVAVSM